MVSQIFQGHVLYDITCVNCIHYLDYYNQTEYVDSYNNCKKYAPYIESRENKYVLIKLNKCHN